jgi:hypothetical protein
MRPRWLGGHEDSGKVEHPITMGRERSGRRCSVDRGTELKGA